MNHTLEITSGVLAEKCGQKLSDFFKKDESRKRKKSGKKISRLMLSHNLKLANQFQLNHVALSIRWPQKNDDILKNHDVQKVEKDVGQLKHNGDCDQ